MPRYTSEQQAVLAAVEATLEARGFARWEFTMERIEMLLHLLGDPQKTFRSIHITGTNGKTSTSRFIDQLLQAHGLKTGRFTSPHLHDVTERISLNGEPIDPQRLAEVYSEIAPMVDMVDEKFTESLTYFDVNVALAFAAFADAPVDVGVVEVGIGGATDSTNVLGSEVAVITPIALDHTRYLGETFAEIASVKAGIVHPGSTLVTAEQPTEAMAALLRRARDTGSGLVAEGRSYQVVSRELAVGGQMVSIETKAARYDDLFLPVHGEHQAHNAATAVAAVETLLGNGEQKELDREVLEEAFGQFSTPGRLEVVRTSPTVILDAAHNPAGMDATVRAVDSEFTFRKLIGVVGILADKEADYMLELLEPVLDEVVITRPTSDRAMPAATLGEKANDVFGPERVTVVSRLDEAISTAMQEAENDDDAYEAGGGVLVTGSVFTVSDARRLLVRE
ncbi:bifunctional folylpolyglutamate synthase/dihydrofolate synthase [Haloglycomyces albus]|uniref:bifunctional folylpolyglutamate synthase/dihydrofolate synthase n=1 Tax=Haloglycomyces albus TaxID=526067 RepID=UPI00046CC7D6|nr:cyanophycin synthetase [Haloglycomyces albus]